MTCREKFITAIAKLEENRKITSQAMLEHSPAVYNTFSAAMCDYICGIMRYGINRSMVYSLSKYKNLDAEDLAQTLFVSFIQPRTKGAKLGISRLDTVLAESDADKRCDLIETIVYRTLLDNVKCGIDTSRMSLDEMLTDEDESFSFLKILHIPHEEEPESITVSKHAIENIFEAMQKNLSAKELVAICSAVLGSGRCNSRELASLDLDSEAVKKLLTTVAENYGVKVKCTVPAAKVSATATEYTKAALSAKKKLKKALGV